MPPPQLRDLEREVFGGSDSEFSDDDDNDDLQLPPSPPQQPSSRSPHKQPQDSSGPDDDDDYVHEKRPAKPSKLSQGSTKRGPDDRPPQRKRKRKTPLDIDPNDLPPDRASKLRLDMQIEAILKPKKANRHRKKKNNDEVLDSFADDEVARLREAMLHAADEDVRAKADKLPATAKLRLLAEVMETLRKASLAQSMMDNNLLEGVRRWLEPLPDASLPALNIQRELFTTIRKMEFIDSSVLKESGLGRVVLFYTKCKRVTPDIARVADQLVSTWSRPIIKRSASYRDRVVPIALNAEDAQQRERLNAILARAREENKHRLRKDAVHIPSNPIDLYTIAPRSSAGVTRPNNISVDVDVERRRKNAERLRTLTRKVQTK
ncbi:Transcription factor iws1 [Leucoagaricus gongylophorus]